MMVFQMRDSVPSPRYSSVSNVLRQWKTLLIPTYRVYRLYDKFKLSGSHYNDQTSGIHCNCLEVV